MRPIIVLCVEDLKKLIPHFTSDMLETHQEEMEKLLYNLGFDQNHSIEIQEGLISRTKFCGVTTTDRIVGVERTDKLWLTSGNASDAAKEYTGDITLRKELNSMKGGVKEKESKENEE